MNNSKNTCLSKNGYNQNKKVIIGFAIFIIAVAIITPVCTGYADIGCTFNPVWDTGIDISNFSSSHQNRHSTDWVNITVTVVNATEVYLNITDAKGSISNESITANSSGNNYWCNRTFEERGNRTYSAFVFANNTDNSSTSSTINFNIYPLADVTMNNITNAADVSHIILSQGMGGNWGATGDPRFCVDDTTENGIVNAGDVSYVIDPARWGWSGDP